MPGNTSIERSKSAPSGHTKHGAGVTIRVHVCLADALPTDVLRRLARAGRCEVVTHQGLDGMLASLTERQPPAVGSAPTGATGHRNRTNGVAKTKAAGIATPPPDPGSWNEANCAVMTTDALLGGANGSPKESPAGVVQDITQRWHTPLMVVPQGPDGDRVAMAAMRAGAIDYIDQTMSEEETLNTLGRLLRRAVDDCQERKGKWEASARIASLTHRERQVMLHLSSGLGTKEVAEQLHLAVKTVENHRAKLLGKLGARSQIEMARIAWIAGETCEIESDPKRLRIAARIRQQLMDNS